ncbi:glycosyltransferase [Halegenticoccus soli]|uniref:glycosyltransferase n=1 Tax=Halegenticoccus soli TaxID=1985678 RepID=UPI000C6D5B68|nr:glycosyltransferase [Halegenticoccus soli]
MWTETPDEPTVSVIVPARDEAAYLPSTLASVRAMDTDVEYELVVVDGASEDETPEIAAAYGADVYDNRGRGIGDARHLGARHAAGDWYAFVDADTVVEPNYLDAMLSFVRERDLVAASSRCRMPGLRPAVMEATINRVFPRLSAPILPGFNFFVESGAYREVGGFPNVPNEDTAFSRRLAAYGETAYHPDVLVETSPRRIGELGLTGTLYHYLKLDWGRYRADY